MDVRAVVYRCVGVEKGRYDHPQLVSKMAVCKAHASKQGWKVQKVTKTKSSVAGVNLDHKRGSRSFG